MGTLAALDADHQVRTAGRRQPHILIRSMPISLRTATARWVRWKQEAFYGNVPINQSRQREETVDRLQPRIIPSLAVISRCSLACVNSVPRYRSSSCRSPLRHRALRQKRRGRCTSFQYRAGRRQQESIMQVLAMPRCLQVVWLLHGAFTRRTPVRDVVS